MTSTNAQVSNLRMSNLKLANWRLHSQRLIDPAFYQPDSVVQHLGAVQSQDYIGAKWAVGLRMSGLEATDAALDKAFNEGTILRTHVMRPTWHFVTPADIRWLLKLTAPRVHALNAYYYRELELDDATLTKAKNVLVKTLEGGKQLIRSELLAVLEQAGLAPTNGNTDGLRRFGHMMMHAELDGILCSGGKRGKQFTYALLDERVNERAPDAKSLERDEALAELTRRYFTSHGPASAKDFSWWSGLTMSDVKAGIEIVKSALGSEVIGDQTYWFSLAAPAPRIDVQSAYLLPNYDEYSVGYTDRSAIFDPIYIEKFDQRASVVMNNVIVINSQVVGTWKRTFKKDTVIISADPFTAFKPAESEAFIAAAQRYGNFLGMDVVLE